MRAGYSFGVYYSDFPATLIMRQLRRPEYLKSVHQVDKFYGTFRLRNKAQHRGQSGRSSAFSGLGSPGAPKWIQDRSHFPHLGPQTPSGGSTSDLVLVSQHRRQ